MKNKFFIIAISFMLIFSVLTFTSCSKKVTENSDNNNRATTIESVEITDVPVQTKDIISLFNQSLDRIRIYKNSYVKSVKREITDIDVDTLSVILKSKNAFKSVFGCTDVKNFHDFSKSENDFIGNLPKGNITEDDITSISAELDEEAICITVELSAVKNPTEENPVFKYCDSFMTVDSIKSNMKNFNIKSEVTSVVTDKTVVVARIDKATSDILSYSVTFEEQFSLIDVTLDEFEGKDVTAKTKSEVVFNNFS